MTDNRRKWSRGISPRIHTACLKGNDCRPSSSNSNQGGDNLHISDNPCPGRRSDPGPEGGDVEADGIGREVGAPDGGGAALR